MDKPLLSNPQPVSVLVPAYNEEALLGRTLTSVHESFSALPTSAPRYELVVCDNNSTDRTAQVAAEHGAQVVFEPHNQISRARNAAAARASNPWLIFLDGDTLLNPLLLQATLELMSSGRVCGGGALVAFDQRQRSSADAMLSLWNRISASLGLAAGSYVYCLREAWAEVGGFEQSVYAGEELYFSRKLKKWGRERGLRFHVLTDTPIVTSARKMEWYGKWQLLGHMLSMARPGALRRRDACDLWYKRPQE